MFIVTTEPGNQPDQVNTRWTFLAFLRRMFFPVKFIYYGI